jgi:type II secretion system protein C
LPKLPAPSPRVLLAAATLAVLGIASGAVINQGVARLIAAPSDAEKPEYEVVADAGPGSGVGEHPKPGTEPEEPKEEEPVRSGASAGLGAARVPSAEEYARIIVRRNIFDSTAVYREPTAATGNGECKADSSTRLLATMVVVPMQYSTALIAEGGDRSVKARPFGIGDMLGSDGKISLIEQKRVCTETNICICMDQTGSRPVAGAAPAAPSAEGGVEKVSENKFTVERSVLDQAMGNLESLATQVRASPHKGPDGEVDGFRLSAIKQGSLFSKLGIKNGDIVHAVNGTPLTSTEGAMSAYGSLKNQGSFSFEITRRNQRMTMDYDVR